MAKVQVLGEYYFSRLLGKTISDAQGRRVGTLRDMAVRWDGMTPRVLGLKTARRSRLMIPVDYIQSIRADHTIELSAAYSREREQALADEDIYVSRWLLDKQIIDLKGLKLVRVNDIALSWVKHDDKRQVILTAVDIGIRGLFRRIGLEWLVKWLSNHLVGWQYINPLQNRTSNLQLNQSSEPLSKLHPADIADILEAMDHNQRVRFLSALDARRAVEALAEVDLDTQVEIISHMDADQAAEILEGMPHDEAANILAELREDATENLLRLMPDEDAQDVRGLLQYEDGTAGALMTTEFIALPEQITAAEAVRAIRQEALAAETVYYIYVADDQGSLRGVLSLRDLILAEPETPLYQLMNSNVIHVLSDSGHQQICETIHKYGLLALPVVDHEQKLLGIITVDDVLGLLMPDYNRAETLLFRRGKRYARG